MIYDWMSLNQNLVGLYSITDLQNCVWLGDDKCGQFMKIWRRFTHALKEPGLAMETKRDLLMDKIPMESKAFGQLMVTFRKLKEGDKDFTLHYLEEMIDAHVKYLHELDLKSRRDAQAKRIATGARGADGSVDATPGPPNVKPKVKPKARRRRSKRRRLLILPTRGRARGVAVRRLEHRNLPGGIRRRCRVGFTIMALTDAGTEEIASFHMLTSL